MPGFSQWNIFLTNNVILQIYNVHNVNNGKVIDLNFFLPFVSLYLYGEMVY